MDSLSIVIPTYTGLDHLAECYDSVLKQLNTPANLEVITVIDGPNSELVHIVESAQSKFEDKGIGFKSIVHTENKGRFEARLRGAIEAKNSHILFLDDRTELDSEYFSKLKKMNEEVIISNVIEKDHPNAISRLLYLLRKKIYKNWGENFTPYYITADNFDSSPKGTAGLVIEKHLFVEACEALKGQDRDLKNISDDTLILKYVSTSRKMLRSDELKVYYHPRSRTVDELKHFYQRGPKFMNYYYKKESRYFIPINLSLLLPLLIGVLVVLSPFLALPILTIVLSTLLMISVYISSNTRDIVTVIIYLPLLAGFFWAGLVVGWWRK